MGGISSARNRDPTSYRRLQSHDGRRRPYRPADRILCASAALPPIMLQCLNIIRVNGFVAHKNLSGSSSQSHKGFTMSLIGVLMDRATAPRTRGQRAAMEGAKAQPNPKKRRRISSTTPVLPPRRLVGDRKGHIMISSSRKGTCVMCAHNLAAEKLANPGTHAGKRAARTVKMCACCDVYVCKGCFDDYHSK